MKKWTPLAAALLLLVSAGAALAADSPAPQGLETQPKCLQASQAQSPQDSVLAQLPELGNFGERLEMAAKPEQEPQNWGECSTTCPGSPIFGIPPYTISCSPGQMCGGIVRNSQGQPCGLRCNGFVQECFPNGCF